MILAFDSYYYEDKAKTVCLLFEKWTDEKPYRIYSEISENVSEYESGAFYKRELPCILHLLAQIEETDIEAIVIDGFVVLDDEGKLGLGGYLYQHLEEKIPVIGVAKTNFAQIHTQKRAVTRGESQRPLYITALGIDIEKATEVVAQMTGEFRIPNLLKLLDTLTKASY